MSFRFAESSNSPSTPSRKNRSLFSHPSTTPAGPPPSYLTNHSTTPAGPPPKSLFGSSYQTSNNTFGRRGLALPGSSPALDEDGDEDAEGEEEEQTAGMLDSSHPLTADKSMFMSSIMSGLRGLKRSRNGQLRDAPESEFPIIARGLAQRAGPTQLHDPDDVVLRGEQVLSRTDRAAQDKRTQLELTLCESAAQLSGSWRDEGEPRTKEGGMGPASDLQFNKASYVASLLFQLHHPHTYKSLRPAQASSSLPKLSGSHRSRGPACALPRALLDWLDTYHNPFPDDYNTILLHQPSPSNHDRFWDLVYASLLRGRYTRAIRLLKDAGWENAATVQDDFPHLQAAEVAEYSDRQLDNIEDAVERCVCVLETCPAAQYDNWDVKGPDWTLFRQRVRQAVKDLESFAGEDDDATTDQPAGNVFHVSAGMGHNGMSLSTASKKAESKVPWSIYESLKLLYGQLLGNVDELVDTSQDWLEASIFLTVWWDGDDQAIRSNDVGRTAKSMSRSQKTREVDVSPLVAYRGRLTDAFASVVDSVDQVFSLDSADPVQVALACLVADSVDSVVALLRTWSLPVTSAVVEMAALGGWLPQARPRSTGLLEQGFSEEDLMVLSHGPGSQQRQSPGELGRDEVLAEYAELLAEKNVFTSSDGKVQKEGWELAISALNRRDDLAGSHRRVTEILDRIELTDESRVDKVLAVCNSLDMAEQGRAIAERYADDLAFQTQAYGSALVYYARAHATAKLRSTLALLTSLCLLQSAAVPLQHTIDPQLRSLLQPERTTLVQLARVDSQAASLLATHLSGYATLRRFYELRDQDCTPSFAGKGAVKPLERKREAAEALTMVLESASDCIRGGLFDSNVESVVAVDGVLALLGETLPLLAQKKRIFTKEQIFHLLRIVEDFATAPIRIRENAESLLQASIHAFRTQSNSPSGILKKSRSDMSGSSYDLLAESIVVSETSSGSTGKTMDVRRTWDWRKGLYGIDTAEVKGKDVLMLVRLALAKEIAREVC